MSAISVEQRAALHAAKLEALVSSRWGRDPGRERRSFGTGAALVGQLPSPSEGLAAWVYPTDRRLGVLGAALIWAARHQIPSVNLFVEDDDAGRLSGALARRAAYFAAPDVAVWPVPAAGTEGDPDPAVPVPAPEHEEPPPAPELLDLLLDTGVEVVVEGGIVRGEVNGLEVARIVHGQTSTGVPLDEPRLEVGVGAADRELTSLVHAGLSPADQLARVVEIVRGIRSPGAPAHPLKRLVRERWLRADAVRQPEFLDLVEVRPVEGAQPRPNLNEPAIATARATTNEGQAVVLAFSVGVDVDLVPAAADARGVVDPEADLWLVLPERDDDTRTRQLVGRLAKSAKVLTVPGDWCT